MRYEERTTALRFELRWLTLAIAILVAHPARSEGIAAGSAEAGAGLRVVSQIGLRFDHSELGGQGTSRDALVLRTQVGKTSGERAFSTGVLIEARVFDDRQQTLIAAGMFNFAKARWTMTASPFLERTFPATGARWLYWGNVQCELTPRSSLGLELYGSIETHRPTKWLAVYTARVSRPFTVSVAIGAGVGSGPDIVTRTTVSWQLGTARR
jgi:hypothetical protein